MPPETPDAHGTERYREANERYWARGYSAENVDAPVFRFYGRILVPDFGMDGSRGERLLDFGCGQAASVAFFRRKGFDAYGVDISEVDLATALERWPDLRDRLARIDPDPRRNGTYFGGGFDVVISTQALYYLPESDLRVCLEGLYDQMNPGAVFYATMIASQALGITTEYFEQSSPASDGMREVSLTNARYALANYYVTFTESEAHLVERFSMFEPRHVGFYFDKLRGDEGLGIHYTFVGTKPGR